MKGSKSDFRVGLVQLTANDRLSDNLKIVSELYTQAARYGADVVVFPENSLFVRVKAGQAIEAPSWEGPELTALSELVTAYKTPLLLTTAMENVSRPDMGMSSMGQTSKIEGELPDRRKLRNSTLFFQPSHAPQVAYEKIHLFDVDVPGAPPSRESDYFESGRCPRVLDIQGWKIGLSICYDLRFAELYRNYAQVVDVIFVPAAFLVPTGEAHWHVLLRARAIENQAFVVAPAQSGRHGEPPNTRRTYGHSLAVDPWGQVILDMGGDSGPQVKVIELQRELIAKVRRQIPMIEHRRL